jgi:hypothetical protein
MWLSIGLICGAVLAGMIFLAHALKVAVAWYSWTLGVLGALILLFMIWNVSASVSEHEMIAARQSLWLFGTPGIILLGVGVFLPWRRHLRKPGVVEN